MQQFSINLRAFDRRIKAILLPLVLALLTGCASVSNPDPLEPINRPIQSFNNVADRFLIRPLAQGYKAITPDPVEQGVVRFFRNLSELTNASNQLLQGKPVLALNDIGRFVVNSTLGLAGFLDPASELGLEPHSEDFGQTLGVWGVPQGPYIVFPFRGPATLRNIVGGFSDQWTLLPLELDHVPTRNSIFAFQIVSLRSQAPMSWPDGIDRYALLRDGFLMRQQMLQEDRGNPFAPMIPPMQGVMPNRASSN
ncbi:MAG: VacJ family lipoprotein [Pseudomonadales bacterium]|nr:VacJ family lipoprotein [Pseudomonadales bacterium]